MTSSAPVPTGPYSPVIRRGDMVWTAGVVGRHPDGTVDPDLADQVRRTVSNLEARLGTVGARLEDVVAVTVHLSDLARTQEFNAVYATLLAEPYPVRTTVGADLAPGVLVEVTAQAVVGGSSGIGADAGEG